jgi:hypothetical protein
VTDTYCYLRLQAEGRESSQLLNDLRAEVLPGWTQSEIVPWGVFTGLFGVASNELIVVAAAQGVRQTSDFTDPLQRIAQPREILSLANTTRPVAISPLERAGLYVFRFFYVSNKDVDEIVRLSQEAWTTFEDSTQYAAQPQGLFCEQDLAPERGTMLLLTWYDGLQSWQTSRQPAHEARENFQRRQALTHGTLALATRLVSAANLAERLPRTHQLAG